MKHDRFARFGLWRAEVINVADPEFRGRIQVRVLHLHPPGLQPSSSGDAGGAAKSDILVKANTTGATAFEGVPPDSCPWAEPAYPFGGKKGFNAGFVMTPYVGSTVWVAFEMGYSGRPVWFGSWLGKDEIPEEIVNADKMQDIRLIRTEFGHLLLFDDTPSDARAFLGVCPDTGDRVRFLELDEANKEVRLFNDPDGAGTGTGTRIYMTEDEMIISKGDPASAQVITLDSSKIEVKAGTSVVTITKNGDITISSPAGNITATAGGNAVVNATGSVGVTAGTTATIQAGGAASIIAPTGVNLGGVAGGQGVCLDSLIAVIAAAYGIFNAHKHEYNPNGSGIPAMTSIPQLVPAGPTTPMVPPVAGVNSSSIVKSIL